MNGRWFHEIKLVISYLSAGARILSGVTLERMTFLGPSAVLSDENRTASDEDKVCLWEMAPVPLCVGPDVTIASGSVLLCPDKGDEVLPARVVGGSGWAVMYKPPEALGDSDSDTSDDEMDKCFDRKTESKVTEDIWTSTVEREKAAHVAMCPGRMSRYNSCSIDDSNIGLRQRSSASSSRQLLNAGDLDETDHVTDLTDAERSEEVIIDELKCTLERCLRENLLVENTIVEVNALKHAYAQNIEDLYFLICKAFLQLTKERLPPAERDSNAKLFSKEFCSTTDKFKPLLDHFYKTSEVTSHLSHASRYLERMDPDFKHVLFGMNVENGRAFRLTVPKVHPL
ncbi:Translation initiation factor eIF-2B subunit epsilon [Cichlidogyrus casuarinus]|uniref:Translation initiation factor eIF-2B subunit epsilon n=1 Tax=Cichlidogyrus casuarinus TaxID=1844966 RepID=A0ABD2PRW7_9PLAT